VLSSRKAGRVYDPAWAYPARPSSANSARSSQLSELRKQLAASSVRIVKPGAPRLTMGGVMDKLPGSSMAALANASARTYVGLQTAKRSTGAPTSCSTAVGKDPESPPGEVTVELVSPAPRGKVQVRGKETL
jgi:hypothetical protein